MENLLTQFALAHNLKTITEDEDEVIRGRWGSVYFYSSGVLAAHITSDWVRARGSLADRSGCAVAQNGDIEGIVIFDPYNKPQVLKVLKYVGLRREDMETPDNTSSATDAQAPLRQRPIGDKC